MPVRGCVQRRVDLCLLAHSVVLVCKSRASPTRECGTLSPSSSTDAALKTDRKSVRAQLILVNALHSIQLVSVLEHLPYFCVLLADRLQHVSLAVPVSLTFLDYCTG